MRRLSTILAIALCTLWLISVSSSQQAATTSVPNLIRYSGTLKDAQGAALYSSTAVGVTFSIYKQQDGSAPVWMETQSVTPDANGQYSVVLGSTTATGLPNDLFSQEEQRWLGVQVQGQPEQARVLLVSVPYAFKAHEAETLAGKSISDFVLAKDVNAANSGAGVAATSGTGSTQSTAGKNNAKSPSNLATAQGPTNFSGTTTDQIVSAVQSGTGKAIVASSSTGNAIVATTSSTTTTTYAVSGTIPGAGVAILGHASSATAQGYGIQGTSDSNIGIGLLGFATATTGSTYGLKGYSSSTGGTGVRGLSTATTGLTTGISASVASAAGTAGVFNNTAGGKILSGQNNGAEKFSVDGSGNVKGNQLISTVATGTAPFQVTSTTQVPNLNASLLGGSPPSSFATSSGSPNYIQNGTSQQTGANFNVSGNGSVGGTLLGNAVNSTTSYQIGGAGVLSIGNGADNGDVFLGVGAGTNGAGSSQNTFSGAYSGHSSTGSGNVFTGVYAGYNNTNGSGNTFSGAFAGYSNTYASSNTFSGSQAGYGNTSGSLNSFYGDQAGRSNSTGSYNTFSGHVAGYSNTVGNSNAFFGSAAGYSSTGSYNTFVGFQAGNFNTTGNNNIYIGNLGVSPGTESSTIRIGGDLGYGYGTQTAAYIAGIYGNSPSGALPVVINSSGQLGTGSSGASGVSSWNGRTGAVVPVANDYSFSLLSGALGSSQLSGTYGTAVTLSNTSNVYYGNGANLTGVVAGAGSPYYIQNGTSQQSSANFNISGRGSANTFISGTTYQVATMVGPSVVLSTGNTFDGSDLFLGVGAGANDVGGSGVGNTFTGYQAGSSNTTGSYNTFSGYQAGYSNNGQINTFTGYKAGYSNTTGYWNTFTGDQAGNSNSTGFQNTFDGAAAGEGNTTGQSNTFIGYGAGSSNTTGSSNIYIGASGVATESGAIRIGTPSSSVAYIAGIYGVNVGGVNVQINSSGQLGANTSSRRFKEQILDMGDSSSKLFQLRPVTFFYKPQYDDGSHTLQYGLIAEEVAKIYPDLVAYDKDGAPYTVKYQYLAPMLLNELQKQHRLVAAQQDVIKTQQGQIQTQGQQIADLQERLSRLESFIAKK